MQGHTVVREIGTSPAIASVIGVGSREQALTTAEDMASTCAGVFGVLDGCGRMIARFHGDTAEVFG